MTGYDLLKELQDMSSEELDLEVISRYYTEGSEYYPDHQKEKDIDEVTIGVKCYHSKEKYIILD